MKNGSCRDGAHRLKSIIAVQNLCPSRKWPLAALAPSRYSHEAEHPSQSFDKTCARNMKGLPSLNSN